MVETVRRRGVVLALLACMGCTVESSGKTDSAIAPVLAVDSLTGLAADIDQVPRAADAQEVKLERGPSGPTKTGDEVEQRAPNPFAVLAKLKPGKAE